MPTKSIEKQIDITSPEEAEDLIEALEEAQRKSEVDKTLECPHCRAQNELTDTHRKDMEEVGKAVTHCQNCDTLFVWRDDGDGEYTY